MAGFKKFAMHITDDVGKRAFPLLQQERGRLRSFAAATTDQATVDPETAARRILEQALASDTVASFSAPSAAGKKAEFRSLGTETIPLTGTTVVKFRQYFDKIPVYSSLVTVELDDDNECVSLSSNIAQPGKINTVAKISPAEALRTASKAAGHGSKSVDAVYRLYIYLDRKGTWRLVYIVENVPIKSKPGGAKTKSKGHRHKPLKVDYVIDAATGKIVAELPRTLAAKAQISATDELGNVRSLEVTSKAGKHVLIDETLGVETYDFNFDDPEKNAKKLPGKIVSNPPSPSPAAVSAHANTAAVAAFLRNVLKRNNIDNKGGRLVSTINCVVKKESNLPKQWFNAFWNDKQMVYGQVDFNGTLRSLASNLDVVAHEMFHGVTVATCNLQYQDQSGALDESYADIFGTIISNFHIPNIDKWNWQCGDATSTSEKAFRDMSDPTLFKQPKHMQHYLQTSKDYGGVHTNSGIHNFAAYCIMTSKDDAGNFLFTPTELAALFYLSLTQHLNAQSQFNESRTGVIQWARSLFSNLPADALEARVKAIENGFSAAGIS